MSLHAMHKYFTLQCEGIPLGGDSSPSQAQFSKGMDLRIASFL